MCKNLHQSVKVHASTAGLRQHKYTTSRVALHGVWIRCTVLERCREGQGSGISTTLQQGAGMFGAMVLTAAAFGAAGLVAHALFREYAGHRAGGI